MAAVTPFNPAQPVVQEDGSALSDTTTSTTPLLIAGNPATLLLGAKTAGSNANSYVAAPLVDITSSQVAGLSGPARVDATPGGWATKA